ncbi:MAG: hypothetical protein P1V51_18520 [Deltaproteobacteria bacterium]|nr:hypothetical protein [Deltaproteobacteria bacterium]
MRHALLPPLALCALLLALPGCPEEGGQDDELTIVVQADTEKLESEARQIAEREAELKRQRQEILSARKKLLDDGTQSSDLRALVEQQRKLLEREAAISQREAEIDSQRAVLDAEKTRLITQGARPRDVGATPAPVSPAGGGVDPEASRKLVEREGKMAGREADLARREKALAEREAALALREAALAGAAAPARVAASDPGRRVGRKEVERDHKKARQTMRARGILPSDLTGDASNLQQQIYQHSKAGRWLQAADAVEEFERAVQAIAIDEAFIQAKMARLNAARKKAKLNAEKRTKVDSVLASATGAFADGRHGEANQRLNEIFGILQGR